MAEMAKIETLYDHDTGKPVAPRTVVQAISGEGKKWNYVGFTEDNVLGLIDGTWPCNRNLLDNWYFIGGGSQQGGGQFPINQRGKTEYSQNLQYSIDRWIIYNVSVVVQNGYIEIESNGESGFAFGQKIENSPWEKEVTFSVLLSDGSLITGTAIAPRKDDLDYTTVDLASDFDHEIVLRMQAIGGYLQLLIYPMYSTTTLRITAAKLELGSTQTLAHKEGDIWVLNDPPPNYQQELAKCQRYQISLDSIFPNSSYIGPFTVGTPPTDSSQGHMYAYVPLPVGMRARPSITVKDASKIGHWNPGGYAVSVESFTFVGGDNKGISICANISPTSTVLPKGFAGFLYTTKSSPAGIMLDANL